MSWDSIEPPNQKLYQNNFHDSDALAQSSPDHV